ncbi:MAG: hypothetical protein M3512_07580 [Bacteroidota bacterium]|nr:hypothetical protein [Bacteroidota bacterium]
MESPTEDIHLAGLYMEKAANRYKISRILYIAAAITPVIYRLTRIQDGDGRAGLFVASTSAIGGLASLGFGFSGDINLKKGSAVLRRLKLQP